MADKNWMAAPIYRGGYRGPSAERDSATVGTQNWESRVENGVESDWRGAANAARRRGAASRRPHCGGVAAVTRCFWGGVVIKPLSEGL